MKIILSENQIKLLEDHSRKEQYDIAMNSAIGTILDEEYIYNYVQILHRNYDDFVDGDLGDRIERFSKYKLENYPIKNLRLDEWDVDPDTVDDFVEKLKTNPNYPPIVIGDGSIIDGIHRANTVAQVEETIKAWVGI